MPLLDKSGGILAMDQLDRFATYLNTKKLVNDKHLPHYLRWVGTFLTHCKKSQSTADSESQLDEFLHNLAKNKEEWQVRQAREAIRIFQYYLAGLQSTTNHNGEQSSTDPHDSWQLLAEKMRESLRLRHRALKTEKSYLQWLRAFYGFIKGKTPSQINSC